MKPATTPHKPLSTRLFYACIKRGFLLIAAALALSVLSGCADEAQTWAADQANLADAIAQASKEAGQ